MASFQGGLVVETPPSSEPVTLDEAKAHIVAGDFDDSLIEKQISSAREWVEVYLKQSLVSRTLKLFLDSFPLSQKIFLPFPPVSDVQSITYLDENGDRQTLDSNKYQFFQSSNPSFLTPAYEEIWPSTRRTYEAVTVQYVAGYGNASKVPNVIKQAMFLIIGQFYHQREEMIPNFLRDAPMSAKNLLSPFRQVTL